MTALEELIARMRETAAAPPATVTVEGWGTLHVKAPTVAEVDQARAQAEPEDGKELARGACRVICSADGSRLFDPENAEHVDLLNAQPWAKLQRVIAAARGGAADPSGN